MHMLPLSLVATLMSFIWSSLWHILANSSSSSCHSTKVPSTPSPSPLNTGRGGTYCPNRAWDNAVTCFPLLTLLSALLGLPWGGDSLACKVTPGSTDCMDVDTTIRGVGIATSAPGAPVRVTSIAGVRSVIAFFAA